MTAKLRPMTKEEAKPHILLVEDARDIREPLARYLREHGYRATTAPDAAAARKVMKGAAIDLVVLDIMMPGEDGLEPLPLDPRDLADSGDPAHRARRGSGPHHRPGDGRRRLYRQAVLAPAN